MYKKLSLYAALLHTFLIQGYNISIDQQSINSDQERLQIKIDLDPTEKILKQTIQVSIDNPSVELTQLQYQTPSEKKYIPEFADSKEIFEHELNFYAELTKNTKQNIDAHVYISFLTLPDHSMHQKIHKIKLLSDLHKDAENLNNSNIHPAVASQLPKYSEQKSFTQKLQDMMQHNDSLWIRLFFAFLLGLLLSLTPCIYPMIPITIGVLQHNQKGKSVVGNLFISLCYAFGLSTTFASLGLLAAFAGASFGGLLSNPIFVLFLVVFIGYMSLTMIGIIDLTLPSFLQKSATTNSAFGPYISAYLFGLISGSVASPCVSPGLALLLTIVATMGNIFAGFLLLFFFGIGMSIPLIMIGTFSSSMNMMPQAGQWMVEIKKALGFIMLATCLYYLNNILPINIFNWLLVAYFTFAALFYIIDSQKDFDKKQKTIKSFIGIILLAIAVVMGLRAYDRMGTSKHEFSEQGIIWADSYEAARASAQAENKLLLLDFWANHCTICKAIDKKLFRKDSVYNALKDHFIFVKVDCSSNSNQEANHLKSLLKVYAQPAILVINPETNDIIKKWSSEPYSMTPDSFVEIMLKIR
ncbi:sulfite exporter TauE/SafE family protein [Candidatus Dependentiae bacterium]|nr:sulfite exporter TauE/SafE family protein [Candidatus Dependentiae bacterium]